MEKLLYTMFTRPANTCPSCKGELMAAIEFPEPPFLGRWCALCPDCGYGQCNIATISIIED